MNVTPFYIQTSHFNSRIISGDSKIFARLLVSFSIALFGLAGCAYTRGPELQARHDIGTTMCERDISRPGTGIIHVAPGQQPKLGDVAEDYDFVVWASALATTRNQVATLIQNDICISWVEKCGGPWLGCWYLPDSSIRRPCKKAKEVSVRDVFGIGKVPAVRLNSSAWDEAMAYAEQLALQACAYEVGSLVRQMPGELEDPDSLDCKIIQRRFCD